MSLSRRNFIKLMGSGAAALGVSGIIQGPAWLNTVSKALAANKAGNIPVIWLQGQSCAGCSVSTINTRFPDIAEVLTSIISLEFHPNIMASSGYPALSILENATKKAGEFVLVVEGSVSTADKGLYSTMGGDDNNPTTTLDWVKKLGPSAKAILNVGTCSSFGGIPAADGQETGAKSVPEILPGATMINIPGCPSHPDWVIGTIAHVLLYGLPELDRDRRPKMFFSNLVHELCERRHYYEEGIMAEDYSDEGCLHELGCKGPIAHCDASIRGWNNRVNWCVRSGGPCIGCTEPSFPDHKGDGLYAALPESALQGIAWVKNKKTAAA